MRIALQDFMFHDRWHDRTLHKAENCATQSRSRGFPYYFLTDANHGVGTTYAMKERLSNPFALLTAAAPAYRPLLPLLNDSACSSSTQGTRFEYKPAVHLFGREKFLPEWAIAITTARKRPHSQVHLVIMSERYVVPFCMQLQTQGR